MNVRRSFGTPAAWLIAIGGTAAVTFIGHELHPNPGAVGFAFLVVVVMSSLRGGLVVGTVASVIATLCYNFFFFAPLYTFRLADSSNWITLAALLITSVTVTRLVIAAQIQAEHAETRRKELEALIEENAHMQAIRESEILKTSLLRAISHDLTTPLTAVTIHTERLKRKAETDDELKPAVTGIIAETDRLKRRIQNLLSMARLEAGKAKPRREPTPPEDLFHAVRENLPLVFEARPVTVEVTEDCPDAEVDPSLALEILVNLIENAHRVSPAGQPLELSAGIHPNDEAFVRIEVRDRGPGIPAGIVDAEGKLQPGAANDVAQRGLGLEIARSLAVANGGSIGIVPRPGGGTIVRLDVPAAHVETTAGSEAS